MQYSDQTGPRKGFGGRARIMAFAPGANCGKGTGETTGARAKVDSDHSAGSGGMQIQRRSLHDEVATRLRDMIIEGVLPAGSRINETELGPRLGVSRTPLREAIKTLASEGLVDLQPSRGGVVRSFSLRDVRDLLEAIKALEQITAFLGCARASDAQIEAVAALHDAMMAEYQARRRLSYFKLNQSIHSAIVALADNPVMSEMHHLLQSRLKRIRYIGNESPDKWADAVAEHETMIKALRARDGAALADVLGEHMDRTLDRVRDTL